MPSPDIDINESLAQQIVDLRADPQELERLYCGNPNAFYGRIAGSAPN